jgi:hypothetical protein
VEGGKKLKIASSGKPPVETSLLTSYQTNGPLNILFVMENVVAVHPSFSFIGQNQGREQLNESGLTCSVGTKDTKKFTFFNLKVYSI